MSVDVLAIGAHPDDVELGVGGTLISLAAQGYSTAILDLTRGERSSRGTVEERMEEADAAAGALSVENRFNAEIPDGEVANSAEHQQRVIPFIRMLRPRVILVHLDRDRHPDHRGAHDLVHDANFFAGVAGITSEDAPHRAEMIYTYTPYADSEVPPQLIVDITEAFEQKRIALAAYRSQFFNPGYPGPETYVSSEAFWEHVRTRAEYWGYRAGVQYGEPLHRGTPLTVSSLPELERIT